MDADEAGIDLFLVIRKTLMGHFISYTSQGVGAGSILVRVWSILT